MLAAHIQMHPDYFYNSMNSDQTVPKSGFILLAICPYSMLAIFIIGNKSVSIDEQADDYCSDRWDYVQV